MISSHELAHHEPSAHELIQKQLLDYFFGSPQKAEERARYERTGIIPTNNLYLYFLAQPEGEDANQPRAYDYRQRPFSEVFESLKADDPGLWNMASQVAAASQQISEHLLQLLRDGKRDEARAYQATVDTASEVRAAVFSYVIERLAPGLLASGYEPINVCT